MKIVQGYFNGTGAVAYLCLGNIPHIIRMWDMEAATPTTLEWAKCMQSTPGNLTVEGIYLDAAGGAVQDMAFGEGVSPYYGGETLTSAMQTSTTYGEGVYLSVDDRDYRYVNNAALGVLGDAATETIKTWTLDTAATPTGHFNGDVTGTYIGPGSIIRVKSKTSPFRLYEACITALTAGQGLSANEVTLSWAIPSGDVVHIGGMYQWAPMAVGSITEAGLKINNTTLNTNNHTVGFVAWMD